MPRETPDSIAARVKLATTDVREAVALILDAAYAAPVDALPGLELALGCILSADEAPAAVVLSHARYEAPDPTDECPGHPAGPYDPMGETVFCDGSCS